MQFNGVHVCIMASPPVFFRLEKRTVSAMTASISIHKKDVQVQSGIRSTIGG
jgi:hypothetical protein